MNLYIWHHEEGCTSNWHDEGAVVVIAETLERARQIAAAHMACKTAPKDDPDEMRAGIEGPEACWIHQDAGCC